MDLNTVCLTGRFTGDPELKKTPQGNSVIKFSLANSTMKDKVSFFNCEAWKKTADLIAEHCKKGDRVAVEGRLNQDRWEKEGKKQSVIKIVVQSIIFLSAKKAEAAPQNHVPENEYEEPLEVPENL